MLIGSEVSANSQGTEQPLPSSILRPEPHGQRSGISPLWPGSVGEPEEVLGQCVDLIVIAGQGERGELCEQVAEPGGGWRK